MTLIQFTRNNRDHSNDSGFQFEFFCDKCGNGHMSQFVANKLSIATNIIRGLGSVFGGRMSQVGYASSQMKDMFRSKARDDAFSQAVNEAKTHFKQCTRCGKWVCPNVCWNSKRNLCESCAPDLAEETAAAQAQASRDQIFRKANKTDLVEDIDIKREQLASCPHCNAQIEGGKFCPECGKELVQKILCKECKTEHNGKFCPQCGTAVSSH